MPEHDPNRVLIFDTTLRDGEQSPGCSMTPPEKLRIARALADLGVDVIEAGFPAASRGDWESVQSIAREVEGPVIAGLARCNAEDIDRAWSAIRHAKRPRHASFPGHERDSPRVQAQHGTRGDHPRRGAGREACAVTVPGCRVLARRMRRAPSSEFLAEVVEAAIEAGATTINIPDTVGYAVPEEYFEMFQYLQEARSGHR